MKRKRFLAVCVLFAAGWAAWRLNHLGAILDESRECGEFEAKVNSVLSGYRVQEQDVKSVFRIEKRDKFPVPTSWVETDRRIRMNPGWNLKEVVRELEECAHESDLLVISKRVADDKADLSMGKRGRIYQKLVLERKRR